MLLQQEEMVHLLAKKKKKGLGRNRKQKNVSKPFEETESLSADTSGRLHTRTDTFKTAALLKGLGCKS